MQVQCTTYRIQGSTKSRGWLSMSYLPQYGRCWNLEMHRTIVPASDFICKAMLTVLLVQTMCFSLQPSAFSSSIISLISMISNHVCGYQTFLLYIPSLRCRVLELSLTVMEIVTLDYGNSTLLAHIRILNWRFHLTYLLKTRKKVSFELILRKIKKYYLHLLITQHVHHLSQDWSHANISCL